MSTAQRLAVGLFYAAIAVLGATYAVFEHHQTNRLVHSINEMLPSFLIIVLVLVVYGLLRTAVSVLAELDGVARAAHAKLHEGYGKS